MTLSEGIKQQGSPYVIKGCNRRMLPDLFKELGYTTGAEIGVHTGEFSEAFCQVGIKMYSIDPYIAYSGAGAGTANQSVQDSVYEEAKTRLSRYGELSVLIRKTSEDALEDFKDNSLDFVYVDGNHIFSYFAFDLYNWSNKVRKGGMISGHDYFNVPHHPRKRCHVKAIVDAYVNLFGIENWWLIEGIRGDRREHKYPSWMWFKL